MSFEACICILAHNEERHIAGTIRSLMDATQQNPMEITVYANGCTDQTARIVQELCQEHSRLHLKEIARASKVNAWNIAFRENDSPCLIFSDGDIVAEEDTVSQLLATIHGEELSLASCYHWPCFEKVGFAQKFAGFLQIPVKENFVSGALYIIRKKDYEALFQKYGLQGIPEEVVGEDVFLEKITPKEKRVCCGSRVYYFPPSIHDYIKYLARIRWQNEQIVYIFKKNGMDIFEQGKNMSFLREKLSGGKISFMGVCAYFCRYIFKLANKKRIESCYGKLGPVERGSSLILKETRSLSTK